MGLLDDAIGFAAGVGATARNVSEYLWFGGLAMEFEYSPFHVVAQAPMYRLRRYFPDDIPLSDLPPLILVPPLMMMADVYDVAPKASAVRAIHELGVDVWVIDFGRPETEPGGMRRTVADHVQAVADVVDVVRAETGRNVALSGYSQGGLFCYQATAHRQGDGVDSIIAFGTPIDFDEAPLPTPLVPLSAQSFTHVAQALAATGLLPHVSIPRWLIKTSTRLTDPVRVAEFQLQYYLKLHNREALLPAEQQRRFLAKEGLTDYPGTALQGLAELVAENRLMLGGQVVGDKVISLSDVEVPVLLVLGENDREGHPDAARAISSAAPRADIFETVLPVGHFGLVAGNGARRNSWPRVAQWLRWRADSTPLPDEIRPAAESLPGRTWTAGRNFARAQAVADTAVEVAYSAAISASRLLDTVSDVVREQLSGIPVLGSLVLLRQELDDSVSSLIARYAAQHPDGPAVFAGTHVITWSALDDSVEEFVRRLVGFGIRSGERVAVLLEMSVEGVAVVAALNRLGAVSAILHGDQGGLLAEALSTVGSSWLIVDAAHATVQVPEGIRVGVTDGDERTPGDRFRLNAVNASRVTLPTWYRRDPQRAGDVVFLFLDGSNASYDAITRRQWAVAAHAAAKVAHMGTAGTVYLSAPAADPATILFLLGGALAARSRIGISTTAAPSGFWAEARRYGVTHAGVDARLLRALTNAEPDPSEVGQSVVHFVASALPAGLAHRARVRFCPTKVLQLHYLPGTEAVLVSDSSGAGLLGKPAVGGPRVVVVRCDLGSGRVDFSANGNAVEVVPGEAGVLLVQANHDAAGEFVIHDVFVPGDHWQLTSELARVDHDGLMWSVGPVSEVLDLDGQWASPSVIVAALEAISSVDQAEICWTESSGELTARVSLLPHGELTAWDLLWATTELVPSGRPMHVRLMDSKTYQESHKCDGWVWCSAESTYRSVGGEQD